MALSKLFLTPEKELEDKKISDVLPDSFWDTNFWLYWQTMFAFQRWSSALEMKRYLCRYVHHIDGLPDFSALRFTKYNQYESMILPLVKYLEAHGVSIEYGMDVKNVVIETKGDKKVAKQIVYVKDGKEQTLNLTENDLVFITNGCCTDTSCYGDQTHAPDLVKTDRRCIESTVISRMGERKLRISCKNMADQFPVDQIFAFINRNSREILETAANQIIEFVGRTDTGIRAKSPDDRILIGKFMIFHLFFLLFLIRFKDFFENEGLTVGNECESKQYHQQLHWTGKYTECDDGNINKRKSNG